VGNRLPEAVISGRESGDEHGREHGSLNGTTPFSEESPKLGTKWSAYVDTADYSPRLGSQTYRIAMTLAGLPCLDR
jgi:hypothetical protein